MTALICTCIRDTDPRYVAVPDPTCTHPTELADRDARRAALMLGRVLTVTVALVAALTVAAIWPGTAWAALTTTCAVAIIARVFYVATTTKEQP